MVCCPQNVTVGMPLVLGACGIKRLGGTYELVLGRGVNSFVCGWY